MSSSSSFDLIQEQWWHGVSLWYNDQDYLAAMHVWWSMIDDEPWEDYDVPLLTGITGKEAADNNDKYPSAIVKSSGQKNEQKRGWMAPLLLFLAGCKFCRAVHLISSNDAQTSPSIVHNFRLFGCG
jgi:hypothetical protein